MLSDHGSCRQQPALASSQTQPREEPKTKDAAPHHAPSAPLRGKRVAGSHTQEVRQSVGQRSGWGEGSSGRRLRMGILQGSEGLGGQEAGGPGRNQGLNCWEAGIRDGSQEDKERVSGASAPRGPQSKDRSLVSHPCCPQGVRTRAAGVSHAQSSGRLPPGPHHGLLSLGSPELPFKAYGLPPFDRRGN